MSTSTNSQENTSPTMASRTRRPSWAPPVGRAVYLLTVHRARLRRAARHAGSPEGAQRLRRLARRRKADVKQLVRTSPPNVTAPQPIPHDVVEPGTAHHLALANEMATLAAALRSNRRARAAIEEAAGATPPNVVAAKLARVGNDLELEARSLNQRLRDVAVVDIETSHQDRELI